MNQSLAAPGHIEVVEASPDQARDLLDHAAQRLLGMSGEEFRRAWAAGELDGEPERPGVAEVAMLLPFGG